MSTPTCQWCGRRPGSHVDHVVMRSADRSLIHDPRNQRRLCAVCHAARHRLKLTDQDGFSCRLCPRLPLCRAGLSLYAPPPEIQDPVQPQAL